MKTFKEWSIATALQEAADIPPEKRTFKNIPRYATGKPKVPFTTWLGLKGQGSQGSDGKFYGWSHRAVYGFSVGDTIKGDSIGNKYNAEFEPKYNAMADKDGYEVADKWLSAQRKGLKPYTIKTDAEAKEHAIRFGKEVS